MLIGYARVARADHNLEHQRSALQAAGCEQVFTDIASGPKAERPGLTEALQTCGAGDVLVVSRLDRLGRDLSDLVRTVRELREREIGFCSLEEDLGTTHPGGELVAHLFACLAKFERDLIVERTQPGRDAARAQGRLGGRPPGVADETKRQAALALKQDTTLSVKEICERVGISRNTYYKYTRAPSPDPQPRTMQVQLTLEVENNSQYVRGRKKARAAIERWVLSRYGLRAADQGGPEYLLTIPYTTDEELDQIIDGIWGEAANIAEDRHCFVEGDTFSLEDPERSW